MSKLYWAKDSYSQIQLNDVRVLLKQVEDLDSGYLLKWVESLGLEDIYKEVV